MSTSNQQAFKANWANYGVTSSYQQAAYEFSDDTAFTGGYGTSLIFFLRYPQVFFPKRAHHKHINFPCTAEHAG